MKIRDLKDKLTEFVKTHQLEKNTKKQEHFLKMNSIIPH